MVGENAGVWERERDLVANAGLYDCSFHRNKTLPRKSDSTVLSSLPSHVMNNMNMNKNTNNNKKNNAERKAERKEQRNAKFAAKLATTLESVSNMPTARLERMHAQKSKAAAKAAAKGNVERSDQLTAFVQALEEELILRDTQMSTSASASNDDSEDSDVDVPEENAAGSSSSSKWLTKVPRHVLYRRRAKKRVALIGAADADDFERVTRLQSHLDDINAEIASRKSATVNTNEDEDEGDVMDVQAEIEACLQAGEDVPASLVRSLIEVQRETLSMVPPPHRGHRRGSRPGPRRRRGGPNHRGRGPRGHGHRGHRGHRGRRAHCHRQRDIQAC